MPHHYLRFERLVEFECDRNDNQKSRCRERVCKSYILSDEIEQEGRDNAYQRKEDCSEQRNTVVNPLKIIGRGFSGTNAGNESAVLLNVFGYVLGIELNHRVEVCEEDDKHYHKDVVYQTSPPCTARSSHVSHPPLSESAFGKFGNKADYHLREHNKRRREDDRHNARRVYPDGNERRLSAVHFIAFDLLCVLNGDSSLAAVHKYDEREQQQYENQESEDIPQFGGVGGNGSECVEQRGARRRNNTDEDDERGSVANAVFGNPLAEPHNHYAARDEHYHDVHHRKPVALHSVNGIDIVFPDKRHAYRLNDTQQYCDVSRDLSDLFAAFFAVLAHLFEFRNDESQKLHYNETIDKRDNSESKKRTLRKRTTRYRTDDIQE